jgi:hypothetical protein
LPEQRKQPTKAQSRKAVADRQDGGYTVPVLAEPKGGPVPGGPKGKQQAKPDNGPD